MNESMHSVDPCTSGTVAEDRSTVQGDRAGASEAECTDVLMPQVYAELRRLAVSRMKQETPGQTVQATALVHEAYIRLKNSSGGDRWENRGHFFAAAAETMRRILIEAARRKSRLRHGGEHQRVNLDADTPAPEAQPDLLALNDSLDRLAEADAVAAELVKLRYFGGLTVEEAASAMGMSVRSAYYTWDFARSWLRADLRGG